MSFHDSWQECFTSFLHFFGDHNSFQWHFFIINIFAPYLKTWEFIGRRAGNSSGWLLEPALETDLAGWRNGFRVWKAIPRGICKKKVLLQWAHRELHFVPLPIGCKKWSFFASKERLFLLFKKLYHTILTCSVYNRVKPHTAVTCVGMSSLLKIRGKKHFFFPSGKITACFIYQKHLSKRF